MRAKVRQLYISLFHAYARKNNMWILDHGEALLKVDPLQPAQVVESEKSTFVPGILDRAQILDLPQILDPPHLYDTAVTPAKWL